jgi:Domain of unknown function (DUF3846)
MKDHCDAGPPSPTALKLAEKLKPRHNAKLIKTDGSVITVEPKNGTDFQLDELNEFVDGYIEVIRPPSMPGVIMVINEEGKLKGLPYNVVATLIWQCDDIVGNVLLCHHSQVK